MKTVLLIEDDLDHQRIYSEKLKKEGFQVHISSNSDSGFHSAIENRPNIILLDIMLPGKMNGFELLEMLRKNTKTKNIPIIVLTNLDTEKENALKSGAKDYIIKADIDLNDLVGKVKTHAN